MSDDRLSKAEAIAKADQTWAEWRGFLVSEIDAKRAESRGVDGWTLAEAAAHVARWQDWAVARLRGLLAGERIERLDVDAKNAAWAEEDRGIPFQTALERMDGAWIALRKAAAGIPEARWRRLVNAVFAANTWEHYEEHLAWRTPPGAVAEREPLKADPQSG
jgi:hypothetical protein